MKRFIVALFLAVLYAGTALAFQPYEYMVPSSEHTASGSVFTAPGYLYGMMIITDGTNAVMVDLYDSANQDAAHASVGTHLIPLWIITTSSTNRAQTLSFAPAVPYSSGLYTSNNCAGTYRMIFYYRER